MLTLQHLFHWKVCARRAGSCEVWGGRSPPLLQDRGPCPGGTPWLQHRGAPAPGTGPPGTSSLDTHTRELRVIHDRHATQDEWCSSRLSLASAWPATDQGQHACRASAVTSTRSERSTGMQNPACVTSTKRLCDTWRVWSFTKKIKILKTSLKDFTEITEIQILKSLWTTVCHLVSDSMGGNGLFFGGLHSPKYLFLVYVLRRVTLPHISKSSSHSMQKRERLSMWESGFMLECIICQLEDDLMTSRWRCLLTGAVCACVCVRRHCC